MLHGKAFLDDIVFRLNEVANFVACSIVVQAFTSAGLDAFNKHDPVSHGGG